jgi:cellulose synthase/poly-beta-1,6-N-acetylglucosamine synthase-like glycosyltransferase
VRYSIITAARNEEKYIFKTLESVVKQSLLPIEWIIINDGSTDKTSELIASYAVQYPWIVQVDLVDFKPEIKSTGGRISHILNIAARALKSDYDIIAKLDADIEFNASFIEKLLAEFSKNEKLGIASGHLIFEGKKESVDYNGNTIRGAVMLIRKEVFREINGFFETKGSGEDTIMSIAARYYGWTTKTFPVYFNHLKSEGTRHSLFYESYITGFYKGSIPYRFDYFLLTQFKYIVKKPFLVGSFFQISGYLYSRFIEQYKPFPEYVKFQLQKEQIRLIKTEFSGLIWK